MSEDINIDPKQKEINYYKKRLSQLSSSHMSLEKNSADLNKDIIQMSEGLRIISELQFYNEDEDFNFNQFLDVFSEKINVSLKMDVTLILERLIGSNSFKPMYIKAYSGYPIEEIKKLEISFPSDYLSSKKISLISEKIKYDDFIECLKKSLNIPFFILYPISHNGNIISYFFIGRREMLLQSGSGLMQYHVNTLGALSGVVSAIKSQIDRNVELETLVNQRTEQLKLEKEKSDKLLLNILPYETSQELKNTGKAIAKEYNSVTVLFTDFKDFTKVSEGLSPQELVNQIDYYFGEFDNIITKYGLEKIKTIGDSYMCVSGLPNENPNHAYNATLAALEIRNFITKVKDKLVENNSTYFDVRIGMHSGPVVAGVVGTKKFAYDIWGDTVNVASRMESSGQVGTINISKNTFDLIKDQFLCHSRGAIEAKNKGLIEMFIVENIK